MTDYGVRKGFLLTFGKNKAGKPITAEMLPKPEEMLRRAERWKPWRSVASWYLWRACDPRQCDARTQAWSNNPGAIGRFRRPTAFIEPLANQQLHHALGGAAQDPVRTNFARMSGLSSIPAIMTHGSTPRRRNGISAFTATSISRRERTPGSKRSRPKTRRRPTTIGTNASPRNVMRPMAPRASSMARTRSSAS